MEHQKKSTNVVLFILLVILAVAFLAPIFIVLINSFKGQFFISDAPFQFPTRETFVEFENYVNGVEAIGFFSAFGYSFYITVLSVLVIVLFTSMTAWFITRVKNWFTQLLYYLFVFSMIVPFQMVMFTMVKTTNFLRLDNPTGVVLIYLGFGAGLSIFMFSGFVKSVPIDIEEAAMIDGCNPLQTYFKVVFPLLRPTMVSVAILEAMWIWNDYLLPTLVLDVQKYKTIPMLIQFFKGSYGRVEWGPMMACIVLAILPIVVLYLLGQKHIIKGVLSGAVKG